MNDFRIRSDARIALVGAVLAFFGCSTAHESGRDHMATVYKELILAMGDETLSVWDHYQAYELLRAAESSAVIPHLIEAIDDDRVFDPEWEWPSGNPEGPTIVRTVGQECRSMLTFTFLRARPRPPHAYRVKDWNQWWEEHKGKSLYEIRQMVEEWEKTGGEAKDK